jgi:cytochrome c553
MFLKNAALFGKFLTPKALLQGFPLVIFFFVIGCKPKSYAEGERLYKKNCANCHMDEGEGLAGLIPPLAGADYLHTHRIDLPCILKNGTHDTLQVNGRTFAENMPAAPGLTDVDITNILNYINQSWGNNNEPFQLNELPYTFFSGVCVQPIVYGSCFGRISVFSPK